MIFASVIACATRVALHPEGVDRNFSDLDNPEYWMVALHPEGVDRNSAVSAIPIAPIVALHPEGVDRNQASGGKSVVEYSRPPPGGRG